MDNKKTSYFNITKPAAYAGKKFLFLLEINYMQSAHLSLRNCYVGYTNNRYIFTQWNTVPTGKESRHCVPY